MGDPHVYGGRWTQMRMSTPMIITTGVSGPSGRQAERVCKGSAPPGHCPISRLWWECRQEARVLGLFGLRAAPASGRGEPGWSTSALTAHRLRRSRPPRPAGVRSALRRDPPGLVSGSGDHHGSLASAGVTCHPETKKPTGQGGLIRVHICTRRRSRRR